MLSVDGISKSFDGFQAVHAVSFALREGERLAVIGPNGAGKSTLFNLVSGHTPPDRGEVRLDDRSLSGLRPHEIVKRGMSRSFQRISIFPRLTVFENVQAAHIAHRGRQYDLITRASDLYRSETAATIADVDLGAEADRQAGMLSYGRQKQLELAVALASEPRLLLLDEPTAGMSPAETAASISLIGRICAQRKLTLLFTEHDMEVVFSIADRILVMHHGEIIAAGDPHTIRADPRVQSVYLGGDHGPA